jgi:hypothetical protein
VAPVIDGWRAVADDTKDLPHTPANVRIVLSRCLEVLLRNRSVAGIFLRDPAGVVAAASQLVESMIELSTRLNVWLAGPQPTIAERLRAIAAMEVLGTALSSITYLGDEATDEELRDVLLDAAAAALRLDRD